MIDEITSVKLSGVVNGAYKINENHNIEMICLTFCQSSNGQKIIF